MKNINISVYILGPIRTNCYIVSNSTTKDCIIIDPADEANRIKEAVNKDGLNVKGVLLTHGHFDHILATKEIANYYNVNIYAGEHEKDLLEDNDKNCISSIGIMFEPIIPDVLLKDQEIITLADMNIQVLHTPGHTKGSVCYYFEEDKILISGDTLFRDSVGRTDLPTGNSSMLINSIREKLMLLEDDVLVLPGHGESTSIGYEKKYNQYF